MLSSSPESLNEPFIRKTIQREESDDTDGPVSPSFLIQQTGYRSKRNVGQYVSDDDDGGSESLVNLKRTTFASDDEREAALSPLRLEHAVTDLEQTAPEDEDDDDMDKYLSEPFTSKNVRRYGSAKQTARGRQWKKKIQKQQGVRKAQRNRVAAYCVAQSLDVADLLQALHLRRQKNVNKLIWPLNDPPVLHDDAVRLHLEDSRREADMFFFSYGCVVTWGLTEDEETEEIAWLREQGVLDEPMDVSPDVVTYRFGDRTVLHRDVITLERVKDLEQISLMKLAVSFGLAQSSKLEVFEDQTNEMVERTESIPRELARTGTIPKDRKTISKLLGEIMLQRNRVHLQHDFFDADMPDFFWQYENLEPIFRHVRTYYDICKRADAINRRLDVLKEVFDVMSQNLHNRHTSMLEMIVIWLIVLECFLTLFTFFYEHYA